MESHYAGKDFWTRAVFFVASQGQLNKAHVQYLESQLVNRADAAKRVPLENGNRPADPTLSEADRADMDVFLYNMLGMLPLLGIDAFEQSPAMTKLDMPLLSCQGKGILANGIDTPQGFVVRTGSDASFAEVPSLKEHLPNVSKVRADLIDNRVLVRDGDKFKFTQDYTFNSPSLASSVVLGRSTNGRTDWKDANGKTLKQIQADQTKG
ncbi:GIY-YIG nuclease family protein [Planctomicrobium piriforme]|uniref:GIY-YIG nuclease family protein n=1 Tax=Planctomicrobium piriforme TaxID=1576369 RepID=UPI001C316865|nr:GIY-YIG nuclease family protein [Planctomicrobium piriforme]